MTISRMLKGLALAGVLAVTGGCVSYPDGTGAFLPPPPPGVIAAPGPVVAPVVVTRPVVYGGGYYRPYYRPYVWGGGYRGGYYGYWGRRYW